MTFGNRGISYIAFGTKAKVAYQNYYMVGAGATALLFFGALTYAQQKLGPPNVPVLPDITGSISGQFPPGMRQVDVSINRTKGYGRWDDRNEFAFFIPDQDPEKIECLRIVISGNPPAPNLPDTYPIDVDAAVLRPILKAGKFLKMYYRGNNPDTAYVVYPSSKPDADPIKDCPGLSPPDRAPHEDTGWLPSLIGKSWAGPLTADEYIKLLLSDDTIERRNARDGLASLGLDAVGPMMAALEQNPDTYRMQVGVIFALREMLLDKGVDPAEIRKRVTDHQFALLSQLVAHPDPTLRKIATPALIDLDDPRSADLMIEILENSNNENGQYNAALVLRAIFDGVTDQEQRQRIVQKLQLLMPHLGSKTNDVLSAILIASNTEPSANVSGWVFSGVTNSDRWTDKLFRYADNSRSGTPQPGDSLIANTEVYLRADMIQFDEKLGWVNAKAVGVIPVGGVFRVEKIDTAKSGYLWLFGTRTK